MQYPFRETLELVDHLEGSIATPAVWTTHRSNTSVGFIRGRAPLVPAVGTSTSLQNLCLESPGGSVPLVAHVRRRVHVI